MDVLRCSDIGVYKRYECPPRCVWYRVVRATHYAHTGMVSFMVQGRYSNLWWCMYTVVKVVLTIS